jgi:hypothetical protein
MTTEKKIPGALVLAISSAMVSLGVVAYLAAGPAAPEPREPKPPPVTVDTGTPVATAESFLDAWRKRRHDIALGLSLGPAHQAVRERQAADARLSEEEYAIKEQVWDRMAHSRLSLHVDRREALRDESPKAAGGAPAAAPPTGAETDIAPRNGDPRAPTGSVLLRGRATGQFLGKPYEREIEFVLARDAERWKVSHMDLGTITSEVPKMLQLGPAPDPTRRAASPANGSSDGEVP